MQQGKRSSVILLLVTTTICLILGEVIVALIAPQQTISVVRGNAPRIFRESDYLPYELLPGAESAHTTPEFSTPIRINSHGYRGPDFEREKRGHLRILVLGDSFTFGHGVTENETYSAVLGRALTQADPGRPIEVINAGYASCNYPDTYYLYLRKAGLALEPDIVVVGFFIGNDIDRQGHMLHEWTQVDSSGLPLRIVGRAAHVEDGYWVSNRRAARHRLPLVRSSHLAQAVITALGRLRAGPRSPVFNEVIYLEEYPDHAAEAAARVRRMFAAMKALTDESGAELVVLEIPTYEQVFPQLVFGESGSLGGLDLLKPQREFNEFFSEVGISYLDLLPEFQDYAPGESLYFHSDQHWTALGHELAGKRLAEWLLSAGAFRSATVVP